MNFCIFCGNKLMGNEVFCPKCGKGVRTKVEIKKDGTKVRVCAKCNEEIK